MGKFTPSGWGFPLMYVMIDPINLSTEKDAREIRNSDNELYA
jgi:hypothetical protein